MIFGWIDNLDKVNEIDGIYLILDRASEQIELDKAFKVR